MFVDIEMTCLAETLRKIHRVNARRIQGTCLIVRARLSGLFKNDSVMAMHAVIVWRKQNF
jgi:hypothetical protein